MKSERKSVIFNVGNAEGLEEMSINTDYRFEELFVEEHSYCLPSVKIKIEKCSPPSSPERSEVQSYKLLSETILPDISTEECVLPDLIPISLVSSFIANNPLITSLPIKLENASPPPSPYGISNDSHGLHTESEDGVRPSETYNLFHIKEETIPRTFDDSERCKSGTTKEMITSDAFGNKTNNIKDTMPSRASFTDLDSCLYSLLTSKDLNAPSSIITSSPSCAKIQEHCEEHVSLVKSSQCSVADPSISLDLPEEIEIAALAQLNKPNCINSSNLTTSVKKTRTPISVLTKKIKVTINPKIVFLKNPKLAKPPAKKTLKKPINLSHMITSSGPNYVKDFKDFEFKNVLDGGSLSLNMTQSEIEKHLPKDMIGLTSSQKLSPVVDQVLTEGTSNCSSPSVNKGESVLETLLVSSSSKQEQHLLVTKVPPKAPPKVSRSKQSRIYDCPECGKIFLKYRSLTIHKRLHTNDFACEICGKRFTYTASMLTHKQRIHEKLKPYTCRICKKRFFDPRELKSHFIDTHTYVRPSKCDLCEKRFSSKLKLKRHYNVIHFQNNPYLCEFRHRRTAFIRKHLRCHSENKPFQCYDCNSHFTKCADLITHYKEYHKKRNGRRYLCEFCGNIYSSITVYKSHSKTCARGENVLHCEICDKEFSRYQYLQRHFECVHSTDYSFKCVICNSEFISIGSLYCHHRKHLNSNNMYSCIKCGKEFLKYFKLKHHLQMVHLY